MGKSTALGPCMHLIQAGLVSSWLGMVAATLALRSFSPPSLSPRTSSGPMSEGPSPFSPGTGTDCIIIHQFPVILSHSSEWELPGHCFSFCAG